MSELLQYVTRHPVAPDDRHIPLTESDHDELFRLFDEADLPPDAMSAEMADGYLTAVTIGPDLLPAHEWLTDVLCGSGKKYKKCCGAAAT